MKVKQAVKAEYVRMNLSSLVSAVEKTFKVSIPPYGYADELHVFQNIKPMKKIGKYSMQEIMTDEDAAMEAFMPFERASKISSSDVDWLLSVAVSSNLVDGKNFIVDMQD